MNNRNQVYLFDDINMCAKDRWGYMGATELVRQYLTYSAWYNTKSCVLRQVRNINFCVTQSLKTDKELVNERLAWNFALIGFTNHQGAHIEQIY